MVARDIALWSLPALTLLACWLGERSGGPKYELQCLWDSASRDRRQARAGRAYAIAWCTPQPQKPFRAGAGWKLQPPFVG